MNLGLHDPRLLGIHGCPMNMTQGYPNSSARQYSWSCCMWGL